MDVSRDNWSQGIWQEPRKLQAKKIARPGGREKYLNLITTWHRRRKKLIWLEIKKYCTKKKWRVFIVNIWSCVSWWIGGGECYFSVQMNYYEILFLSSDELLWDALFLHTSVRIRSELAVFSVSSLEMFLFFSWVLALLGLLSSCCILSVPDGQVPKHSAADAPCPFCRLLTPMGMWNHFYSARKP